MAYGLETFNANGVCQFSTAASSLVKVGTASVTSWTQQSAGHYRATLTLPAGTTQADLLIFAQPASSVSTGVITMWTQGGYLWSNTNKAITVLFAAAPEFKTLETSDYGIEVYDSLGTDIIFSSNTPLLKTIYAGNVTYNSNAPNFNNNIYYPTGTFYGQQVTWANETDRPFVMIQGHGAFAGYASNSYYYSGTGAIFTTAPAFSIGSSNYAVGQYLQVISETYITGGYFYSGLGYAPHMLITETL